MIQAPKTCGKGVISPPSLTVQLSGPVILLGASARSAAQSLARSQILCVTIDQFGDQDTSRFAQSSHVVQSNQQLAARLATYPGRPIVCVGQWPGMIDVIHQSDERFLPGMAAWQSAIRIGCLQTAASRAGLNVPLTTRTQPLGEYASGVLEKQVIHSGGLGVRWNVWGRWTNSERDPTRSDTVYQQWIPGRPYGATFLASNDAVQLLGICRSLFGRIAEFPFVYQGSLGPTNCMDQENRSRILVAAESIVSESGLRGVFNIDFIQSNSGQISLLEVNPRWSASSEIIERSLTESGVLDATQSLMQHSIDAMSGRRLPDLSSVAQSDTRWIKRIIYANRAVVFQRDKATASIANVGSIHDIPKDGELIKAQYPICTLIAKVNPGCPTWWTKYRKAIGGVQCIGRLE